MDLSFEQLLYRGPRRRTRILQSQKAVALEIFIENPKSNISVCELRPESLEILLEC